MLLLRVQEKNILRILRVLYTANKFIVNLYISSFVNYQIVLYFSIKCYANYNTYSSFCRNGQFIERFDQNIDRWKWHCYKRIMSVYLGSKYTFSVFNNLPLDIMVYLAGSCLKHPVINGKFYLLNELSKPIIIVIIWTIPACVCV